MCIKQVHTKQQSVVLSVILTTTMAVSSNRFSLLKRLSNKRTSLVVRNLQIQINIMYLWILTWKSWEFFAVFKFFDISEYRHQYFGDFFAVFKIFDISEWIPTWKSWGFVLFSNILTHIWILTWTIGHCCFQFRVQYYPKSNCIGFFDYHARDHT